MRKTALAREATVTTANSAEPAAAGPGKLSGVKVKKKGGPGDARAFENAALQLARPRRRPPVNAVQRIPC